MRKTNGEKYRERLKELGFRNYKEYLASDIWKKQRTDFYKYRKTIHCQLCKKTYNLNVHHTRYSRLGKENFKKDLILLCRDCHYELHQFLKENPKYWLHSAHRSLARKKRREKQERFISRKII